MIAFDNLDDEEKELDEKPKKLIYSSSFVYLDIQKKIMFIFDTTIFYKFFNCCISIII
jgi:hypothetical protein